MQGSKVGARFAVFAVVLAGALALPAGANAACPRGELRTAEGCASFAEARSELRAIAARAVGDKDARAVLVRIDVGGRRLATASPGKSMDGAPAELGMRFRIGSIAIPFVVDLLLMLEDRGELSLDDPLSKWLPEMRDADRVTLRMLASATSGYPDWVQGNPAFQKELLDDVFRRWSTPELLDAAFSQPSLCDPGECFHYAHTNFAVLGRVIRKVTGRSVQRLLERRVLGPLGMRGTAISGMPAIPAPALHAYSADRPYGSDHPIYEDSTYWSPSYGLPKSMLMTATLADVVRAAKAFGGGTLVSRASQRARLEPITAGIPSVPAAGFSEDFYYGLGVLVANGWAFQNPQINGFASISAYLPQRKIALALTATATPRTARAGTNPSFELFTELTRYLTPGRPAERPG